MTTTALLSIALLAQLAPGGALRVIGQIVPEAAEYIRKAPPGELSPDINIRVLALKEDAYSTCFRTQGALCEVREERGSGPLKILIESDGYEPLTLSFPKVVFGESNVTPLDIGAVRLREAPRPRLVGIAAGPALQQKYRFNLTLRNPAKQSFALRRISVMARKDRRNRSPCDDRRYETYKFTQPVRIAGGAGEVTDQDLTQAPGADERVLELAGSISHNCGDEILNLDASFDVPLPGDLLTTFQIEMPAVIVVPRPGVSQPGDRPLESWNVELERFNSYTFRLTSIRTDASSNKNVVEVLRRDYTLASEPPFRGPFRR